MDWNKIYPGYDDDTEDLTQMETKPIPGVAKALPSMDSSITFLNNSSFFLKIFFPFPVFEYLVGTEKFFV